MQIFQVKNGKVSEAEFIWKGGAGKRFFDMQEIVSLEAKPKGCTARKKW